jgi:hypothetical protein
VMASRQTNEMERYIQTAMLTRSTTKLLVNQVQNQANIITQQAIASANLIEAKVSHGF